MIYDLFNLMEFNNKLYFAASDGTNGDELMVYDGINPPSLVHNICDSSGNSSPSYLTVFNNRLFHLFNNPKTTRFTNI